MSTINSINTALALLRADPRPTKVEQVTPLPPMTALAGDAEISNAITDTINSRGDLRSQYEAAYQRVISQAFRPTFDENSRHLAMVEVIYANRSAFPPGEFAIHTQMPDGASITSFIPALDGSSDYAFVHKVKTTLREAPHDSLARIDAMSRIANVFLMTSAAGLSSLAREAYAETASGLRAD
ncbi:hypothetical protein [Hyphomicrobium sp. D-2]|uniref:hypothetical protein n=1 Tax=Hyphomicrobium sp. D-2 TaxID=3041621 RepID=UPI0024540865|nr:hypothetical protein [Hyphomicrobium sp. D-2]MDH4981603.1 hypothetical protein [Hyphomicrobium sp. D-2]